MNENKRMLRALERIVGQDRVSDRPEERFIYQRDLGNLPPGKMDFLVLPGSCREIRSVMELACREGIPVVPLGGGLGLAGLTILEHGGIVMDLRWMDRIIEVNRESRYAVIEAGVTVGKLLAYLDRKHPDLKFSVPDAPAGATMTGNALIGGSGHLSKYGVTSEMITGLEAVLPNGELFRAGAAALSPKWFYRGNDPDLTGLFVNWFGATGIVTRLGIKLYPKHRFREVQVFSVPNPEGIPDAMRALSATGLAEDIIIFASKPRKSKMLMTLLVVFVTGDSQEETGAKQSLFARIVQELQNGIALIAPSMFPARFLEELLDVPKARRVVAETADLERGGGFDGVGGSLPLRLLPKAFAQGIRIAETYRFKGPIYTFRCMNAGHSVMMTASYPFNRINPAHKERSRNAIAATADMLLDLSGMVWKPGKPEQRLIIQRLNPHTARLIEWVKQHLDPLSIMNPGVWDAGEVPEHA